MRNFFIIFVFCFINFQAYSGPIDSTNYKDSTTIVQDDIINNIAAAINAGDSKKLSSYFNSSIDLTVPGSEGNYSKSQAEMIVKNFFTQYPPVFFKINQQGTSAEGSQFCVGILQTKTLKFRTYFLIKKVNGVPLIHQLQFEEE